MPFRTSRPMNGWGWPGDEDTEIIVPIFSTEPSAMTIQKGLLSRTYIHPMDALLSLLPVFAPLTACLGAGGGFSLVPGSTLRIITPLLKELGLVSETQCLLRMVNGLELVSRTESQWRGIDRLDDGCEMYLSWVETNSSASFKSLVHWPETLVWANKSCSRTSWLWSAYEPML